MVVGSSSYADQGRAKVEARNAGLVRIYADRDRGALGVNLVLKRGDRDGSPFPVPGQLANR